MEAELVPLLESAMLVFWQEHGLDFSRLLDATEYKEKHRADMIRYKTYLF